MKKRGGVSRGFIGERETTKRSTEKSVKRKSGGGEGRNNEGFKPLRGPNGN